MSLTIQQHLALNVMKSTVREISGNSYYGYEADGIIKYFYANWYDPLTNAEQALDLLSKFSNSSLNTYPNGEITCEIVIENKSFICEGETRKNIYFKTCKYKTLIWPALKKHWKTLLFLKASAAGLLLKRINSSYR